MESQPLAGQPPTDDPLGTGEARPKRRGRLRKVLKWLAIGFGGLVLLTVIAVWLVLANLNSPAVKSRVVALIGDVSGLEVDYQGLEVSVWSGVRAESLSVASPARFAAHASEFVRVENLRVDASLWSLPFGAPEIDAIYIGSVRVSVVVDQNGSTTISELFPPSDEPEKEDKDPPTPLSHSLRKLPALAATSITVDSIGGQLVELRGSQPPRVTDVTSLALSGSVKAGSGGLDGTSLKLHAPGDLTVNQSDGDITRRAVFSIEANVAGIASDGVKLDAYLGLKEQNLIELTDSVERVFALSSEASFNKDAGQTTVNISRFALLDDRVDINAVAILPDGESLRVSASGQAKVALEQLPIELDAARISNLSLTAQLEKFGYSDGRVTGKATVSGGLASADLKLEKESVSVGSLTLSADTTFNQPAGEMHAKVELDKLDARSEAQSASLRGFTVEVEGKVNEANGQQRASVAMTTDFDSAKASDGLGKDIAFAGLTIGATAEGAVADLLTGAIDSLSAQLRAGSIIASDGKKSRGEITDTTLDAKIANFRLSEGSPTAVDGTANVTLSIDTASAGSGRAHYVANQATIGLTMPLALETLHGEVEMARAKGPTESVRGVALSLDAVSPLALAPDAPGNGSLRVSGRVGGLAAGKNRAQLSRLSLSVEKPSLSRYKIDLDAKASGMAFDGRALPGPLTTKVRGDAALKGPSLVASVELRGADGARAKVDVDAKFARRGGRLRYKVTAAAERLESFASALAEVAPKGSTIKLKGARLKAGASGNLTGLLASKGGGFPSLVADPVASVRGEQSVTVRLDGLDYREPQRRVAVADLALDLSSRHRKGGAGDAELTLKSSAIDFEDGSQNYIIRDLDEELTAKFERAPNKGVTKVASRLSVASVRQSIFSEYAVERATLTANIDVDRLHSIFLRSLTLNNPASGTRLTALGAVEKTGATSLETLATLPEHEGLSLEGQLTQKLDHLAKWGFAKSASGSVVVPFRLESGDLLSYRLVAKLIATKVSYVGRDGDLVIRDLNGVVPMVEEIALLPTGVVLIPGPQTSPLSRTRFFDVHPFLDSDDYITASSIEFAGQKLGPLAGNIRLARSVFSIDQLQLGYREGQIAGQVRADYREGDPIIRLRLNITGVRPTGSNEVLDANAAVTFVPRTLSVAGKIQIVRIGKDHLIELLNILDPFRETVNINKVRLGLKVGFPKFVRLQMRDGALDAKVSLGGVGKLVRIDEIKSVPLGPIMQTYVAPTLEGIFQPWRPSELPAEADDDESK